MGRNLIPSAQVGIMLPISGIGLGMNNYAWIVHNYALGPRLGWGGECPGGWPRWGKRPPRYFEQNPCITPPRFFHYFDSGRITSTFYNFPPSSSFPATTWAAGSRGVGFFFFPPL